MKKFVLLVALLGVTIFYDIDLEVGFVWVNASTENATILAQSHLNVVTVYDEKGSVRKMTFGEFLKGWGKQLYDRMDSSPIIIHRRPTTVEPKITY